MHRIVLRNKSRPQAPAIQARYCASFWCQLRGLMFTRQLPAGQGLLLVQKRDTRVDASIHMLFMRMNLAVVWINSANEVVDTRRARRWALAYFPSRPARYILELPECHLGDFQVGDRVEMTGVADAQAGR